MEEDRTVWPLQPVRPHLYLSTACLHGKHELCRHDCKYCAAECFCVCHRPTAPVKAR